MNRRSFVRSHLIEPLESRAYLSMTSFEPFRALATGQFPTAVATADLTGLGFQDIVTANYGDGTVSVLKGNGNGNFQPAINYAVGNGPEGLAIADINGDGKPDIVVANSGTNPSQASNIDFDTVSILLNNGDGTFAAKQSFPAGLQPSAVAVADMNGDGAADLLVTSATDGFVRVMLNNGDGTFTVFHDYQVGNRPLAVAAADLNGDGFQDVVTADGGFGFVSVLMGYGNGTLQQKVSYQTGIYPRGLTIADINRDGKLDILVACHSDSTTNVLIGNGKGKFSPNVAFSGGAGAFAVAVADVNGDGRSDIITADQQVQYISVLQRRPIHKGFTKKINFKAGSGNQSLAVADFNGDGQLDLAIASFNSNAVTILLNNTKAAAMILPVVKLTSNTSAAPVGSAVQFTATVVGKGGTPTGEVVFFDGPDEIGQAALVNGVASFNYSGLSIGLRRITAFFGGDLKFGPASVVVNQLITSPVSGPDLIGTYVSGLLPNQFVAGEFAVVRFRVTNQGNAAATGLITNQLFLSSSGAVDANAIHLSVGNSGEKSKISLKPGESTIITRGFVIPANFVPGDYSLLVVVNATHSLVETDTTNNTAGAPGKFTAVDSFGLVAGRPLVPLTLQAANGAVFNYQLIGPGTGIIDNSSGTIDLQLLNTTGASTLLITQISGPQTPLPMDITVNGSIGAILAPSLNQTGTITINGKVRQIYFGSLTSSHVNIADAIQSLTIVSTLTDDSQIVASAFPKTVRIAGVTILPAADPRFSIGSPTTG